MELARSFASALLIRVRIAMATKDVSKTRPASVDKLPPANDWTPEGPPRGRLGDLVTRLQSRSLPAWFGQSSYLARFSLWTILTLLILAPCACFLIIGLSPRLFDEGQQWFTFSNLQGAFSGTAAVALLNSLWVSAAAACFGLVIGFLIAWLTHRTTLPGRRLVVSGLWLVLLLPGWLPAIGWQQLVQPEGVLYRFHVGSTFITHAIMGPFGVVLLLGLRCVPFTYLAISTALSGLGQEFEDAARVHGANWLGSVRFVAPILAPAIISALAIGFAETISDYGVAATLAFSSHFPLATYQVYSEIYSFPTNFPEAAALSWLLVASVAVPLIVQGRALRGRSYAILSGRSRPVTRRELRGKTKALSVGFVTVFFALSLGVPGFGAISSSLLSDYGASFRPTLVNFRAVFTTAGLTGPLERSLVYAAITASVTVVGGFIFARLLSRKHTASTKFLDFLLLTAIALPSVVFGAGYIFAYNLPFLGKIGIHIFETTTLLIVGYVAASLPTNARVLVGAVSQVQSSLQDAARTHGAGAFGAWLRGVFPILSRPLTMAWLLTFCGIFLELPISELLNAPGSPPASVAIQENLGNYHFGIGMAQAVIATFIAFGAVAIVLGGYRLFAPHGWRRIGGSNS